MANDSRVITPYIMGMRVDIERSIHTYKPVSQSVSQKNYIRTHFVFPSTYLPLSEPHILTRPKLMLTFMMRWFHWLCMSPPMCKMKKIIKIITRNYTVYRTN